MKYKRLHLYNWFNYPKTKLTETDLQHILVLSKYESPTILGTKDYILRLHDLTKKFKQWYEK